MKKISAVLSLILIPALILAAANPSEVQYSSQTIAGYINHLESDYLNLSVSYDITSKSGNYKGINIDVSDASNVNRYLITPSASHDPGLRIGTLELETTNRNYKLRIYHTPLQRITNWINNNSKPPYSLDSNTTIDYELSISYTVSGSSTRSAYCRSYTNVISEEVAPNNKIEVSLSGANSSGVILIQNAGLYFRLVDTSQVRTKGQYQSTITVQVGTN